MGDKIFDQIKKELNSFGMYDDNLIEYIAGEAFKFNSFGKITMIITNNTTEVMASIKGTKQYMVWDCRGLVGDPYDLDENKHCIYRIIRYYSDFLGQDYRRDYLYIYLPRLPDLEDFKKREFILRRPKDV